MSAPALPRRRSLARKIVIDLTIMTAIGVVLAYIGPFGSFSLPFSHRLAGWVTFAWIGYAIYAPMGPVADWVARALDLPKAPLWVAAAAFSSLPMTAVVYAMAFVPEPPPWPTLETFFARYPYVFVIGGGVTALFYTLASRTSPAPMTEPAARAPVIAGGPQAPPTPAPQSPLLDALPAALGSDVLALEMEDHYVRVHTALGSELVLMRLRDAMTHMTDIEGLQTHRSWWVARGAVEDVVREGRNVRLVLARGIEAPVSRAQVSELKEAGWI